MSRSIKERPLLCSRAAKRVDEMNQTGEKKVLKTWSRASTIFPSFVAHLCRPPTAASTCPSM